MTKPTPQQCHALTTYFITAYTEKMGRKPAVNRNKARWQAESVLMDYSASDARELLDYYLEHYENPSLEWFMFNYEKVDEAKHDHDEQEKISAKRREATAQRLEEWRNRWKNQQES